jgi:hypothetical protein
VSRAPTRSPDRGCSAGVRPPPPPPHHDAEDRQGDDDGQPDAAHAQAALDRGAEEVAGEHRSRAPDNGAGDVAEQESRYRIPAAPAAKGARGRAKPTNGPRKIVHPPWWSST